MSEPILSHGVIITSYNNYEFCKKRLKELEVQSISPKHVVICDDGFLTERQLRAEFSEYITHYSVPLTLIASDSNFGGPARSRNTGINFLEKKVDIIHITDPDDEWEPAKIQVYDKLFSENVDAILQLRNKPSCAGLTLTLKDFRFQNPAILSSLAIRAQDQPLLFSEEKKYIAVEDYEFYLRYLVNNRNIICVSGETKYNKIAGSLSSNKILMAKKFFMINYKYFGFSSIFYFPIFIFIKLKQYL